MKDPRLSKAMAGVVILAAALTACGQDGPPHVLECEDCPETTGSFLEATVNGPGGPGSIRLDQEHEDVNYLTLHHPGSSTVEVDQFWGVFHHRLDKGVGFALYLPKVDRLPITMPVAERKDDADIDLNEAHFVYIEFRFEGEDIVQSDLANVVGTITLRTFNEDEIRGEFSVEGALLEGPFRGHRGISGTFASYGGVDFGEEP